MSDEVGHQLATRIETRKNCQTCRLGYNIMGMVHRQAINGAPIMDIWRTLIEMEHDGLILKAPSRQSITSHLKNHLGVRDAAIRKHIELRAKQRNKDLESGVESLLTEVARAEVIANLGFQGILEGKIKLDAKDVLTANKQIHDFTKDEAGSLDAATAFVQLGMIMQAIQEIVPDEMWVQIKNRLKVLSEEDEDVYDAEVILDEEDVLYD